MSLALIRVIVKLEKKLPEIIEPKSEKKNTITMTTRMEAKKRGKDNRNLSENNKK